MKHQNNICFATGSLGSEMANPEIAAALADALAKASHCPELLMSYGPPEGMPELRRIIVSLYSAVIWGPDNVLVTAGGQQALELLFSYLKTTNVNAILLQQPCYFGAVRLVRQEMPRIEVCPFSNATELECLMSTKHNSIVYVTSNFQAETGRSFTDQEKV